MNRLDITLHNGFYPTSEIRDLIANVSKQVGFSSEHAYQVKTAMDEALTNIIRHAYKNNPGKIKIQVKFLRNTLTISIKDWGEPLARRRKTIPTDLVAKKKDHGLGLMMIDRLMDKVQRVRRSSYNELIMKKRLNGVPL